MRFRFPAASARIMERLIHGSARFTRPLTIGVRAVVLDPENRVFLVKHSYVPGWHCPGGAVEPGETVHDALLRETREECSIEILGEPQLHGIFFNRRASRRDHVAVFVVREFRQLAARRPDWEIVDTGFFALDALPDGVTGSTRARLNEVALGLMPPKDW